MSLWRRFTNVFRGDQVDCEIDEELQSHIDEAIELGRDPEEVRRSFGSALRTREESHDIKLLSWLDSLRADALFGWRQILKSKTSAAAAILSMALAIGACTAAFRLVDALLLRPLPVSDPGRLFVLAYQVKNQDGTVDTGESFDYPSFRVLRAAVKDSAELMAISYAGRTDVTFGSDQEMEKAYRQWISGWTMSTFGLKPALGRLLTADDDVKPGAHPYAVLSYDYWIRRFGGDKGVIGRTFPYGNDLYEVVGVLEEGFTGTEPGTMTDIFLPTMMNAKAIDQGNWQWFRTWVQVRPGQDVEVVRQKLMAALLASRREQVKTWGPGATKNQIEQYVSAPVFLESAAAGVSSMQKTYRRSIIILAILVALVLLIACANVANLLTAQATSRAREMALRVSIGAGKRRLVQLVLVESTIIAILASMAGAVFAWWAAPFVVGMISPPDNPARFVLPADWRVFGFIAAMTATVTFMFGLAPALRASAVKPVNALKGGADPHARRRLMKAMIAAQVAFCFLVHFVSGLFVSTFDRLSSQSTGFSSDRVLVLEIASKAERPPSSWEQIVERLRSVDGVESVALCGWALMSGSVSVSPVWANGHGPEDGLYPYFQTISPQWLSTMRIPILDGRDFRPEEAYPRVAIVNKAFARHYFDGQNPTGKNFETMVSADRRIAVNIVGYTGDALYDNIREEARPTVYAPFRSFDENNALRSRAWGTVLVRTKSSNPIQLAPQLREQVPEALPEFRVSNIRTQEELVRGQTIRERMLAMLSLFFAAVALLLAGVGLYGVLDYSVVQLRRDIGIRLALGAQADRIVRRVTAEVFSMLILGSAIGLTLGMASERYLETLLFQVKTTDITVLAFPVVTILSAAVFAAVPPVIRALSIDPAAMLRAD